MSTPDFMPKISSYRRSNDDEFGESRALKPSSPQSNKDFRQIYDKEGRGDHEHQDENISQSKKNKTSADARNESEKEATEANASPVGSLFDLSKAKSKKALKPTLPSLDAPALKHPKENPSLDASESSKISGDTQDIFALARKETKAGRLPADFQADEAAAKQRNVGADGRIANAFDQDPKKALKAHDMDIRDKKGDRIKGKDDRDDSDLDAMHKTEAKKDKKIGNNEDSYNGSSANTNDFSRNQPNAMPVIPQQQFVVNTVADVSKTGSARAQSYISEIEKLAAQLVDRIQSTDFEGKTETVIVLDKGAGIFENARVVITEYSTANGQLNIAFENLSNQAQSLLVAKSVQDSLKNALAEGNYYVQNIFSTTIVEHPLLGEGRDQQDDSSSDRGKQGGEGGDRDNEAAF